MFDEELNEVDDFFSGGGFSASIRFRDVGDEVVGVLAKPVKISNVIDLVSKMPQVYPDGNPKKQAVITLQTEWRNWEGVNREKVPQGLEDDGIRTVWAKGNMGFQLKKALREAGVKGAPPVGSMLRFRFDSTKDTGQIQPMKQYLVQYKAPTAESLAKVQTVESSFDSDPWGSPAELQAKPASTLESMRAQGNRDEKAPF